LTEKFYEILDSEEIQIFLREPSIPEPAKQQLKEGYNQMLRKLGLKELD
jgi:hypothetical protein